MLRMPESRCTPRVSNAHHLPLDYPARIHLPEPTCVSVPSRSNMATRARGEQPGDVRTQQWPRAAKERSRKARARPRVNESCTCEKHSASDEEQSGRMVLTPYLRLCDGSLRRRSAVWRKQRSRCCLCRRIGAARCGVAPDLVAREQYETSVAPLPALIHTTQHSHLGHGSP